MPSKSHVYVFAACFYIWGLQLEIVIQFLFDGAVYDIENII
jgi:hypothetical protein